MLLSEINQSAKGTYWMTTNRIHSGKSKAIETVERSVIARGLEEGKERWIGGAQGTFRAVKLLCVVP